MRLINVRTHELHEFIGSEIPSYAILSHRWGNEELTFKEVFKKRIDQNKRGYQKLLMACQIALDYEQDYLWIDTCCIDKRSSAELSEAINSMFAWYKNSKVCLAYLEDVESNGANDKAAFEKSVWFTRCWTLQELLAPKQVDFFDSDWNFMGGKDIRCEEITELTGISRDCLYGDHHVLNIQKWSIAVKMSWASNRQATRSEDIAYSLMGLFNINMPLLYGEGDNAFVRLQEEIIRSTDDVSFLLWESHDSESNLFAKSPASFSRTMVEWLGRYLLGSRIRQVFGLNNLGLEIETQFLKYAPDVYGIALARRGSSSVMAALLVEKCFRDEGCYHRIGVSNDIATLRYPWNEKRKITVLRDTGGKCCQKADNVNMVSSIRSAGIVVHVKVHESATSIKLDKTRSTFYMLGGFDSGFYESSGNVRPGDEFRGELMCTFSSRIPETLRTSWQIDEGPVLWLDVCFDFDSYPCVLLRHQIIRGIPDEGAVQTVAQEHPIDNWNFSNSHMLKVGPSSVGAVSFFYRFGSQNQGAVNIPSELCEPRQRLALEMSQVLNPSNPFSSWRLRVIDAQCPIHRAVSE